MMAHCCNRCTKQFDENGINAGHVEDDDWIGSSWLQRGQDIDGEASGDDFGLSKVSLAVMVILLQLDHHTMTEMEIIQVMEEL